MRRLFLAVLGVVLLAMPMFAANASATPVYEIDEVCVHPYTGEVYAVDCRNMVDLSEGEHELCASRVTGVFSYGDCSRYEVEYIVPDDSPIPACISRVTGQVRYGGYGCSRYELPAVI